VLLAEAIEFLVVSVRILAFSIFITLLLYVCVLTGNALPR
jgi:hypothetical protein